MASTVIMPRQGQSVESCIITTWQKKKGDRVNEGDIIFSYETDKSAFDEPAQFSGVILHTFAEEGDVVDCLAPVCIIGEEGEDISSLLGGAKKEEAPAADSEQEEDAPAEEEKVFYPSEAEDTRAAAEKAFESAAENDQASPDISGEEKKEVPHKGVRGFGSEFNDEPAEKEAPSESELKLKAALKGLMEEPDLEVEAPAQDNRPAAEKAMESAVEAPAAPDLSGVEKADVPHLGIRKLYETVDGMAEGAAEAVKEEVAKISEQAEELASKYDG